MIGSPSLLSSVLKKLTIGVGFGIVAAATNFYLLLSLYGNISIHLGEILVIICLLRHGLIAGLMASLLASLGFYAVTDNPSYFLLFSLEVIFLYHMVKRGASILKADFYYWLFMGLPITFAIVHFAFGIDGDFLLIVLFKQGVNGILSAAVTMLILPFLPGSTLLIDQSNKPRLANQIFSLSVLSITIPSLIIALILTANSAEKAERLIEQQLENKAKYMANQLDNYVVLHQQAVSSFAIIASQLTEENLTQGEFLIKHKAQLPGFTTMLITDKDGKIIAGAPNSYNESLSQRPLNKKNVSDRDYFIEAKLHQQDFISQVFRGRGFGQDPIIALSSPIIKSNKFFGIVEGSLNLPNFLELERRTYASDELLLVSDRNNKIIYASKALNLEVLSLLATKKPNMVSGNEILTMEINNRAYLYSEWLTKEDWSVLILKNPEIIYRYLSQDIIVVSISLIFVILFFLMVARQFSSQITSSLENLVEQFSNGETTKPISVSKIPSREIASLFETLTKAKQLSSEFQDRLSAEVEQKTGQLTKLNQKLEQLARVDGLTQLLNRRTFDEEAQKILKISARQKTPLSFAIIDIDNFKKINDSLGHPAGDYCINALAKRLADTFKRDTDLVGRYGGEEFALILNGADIESHNKMLLQFHQSVADSSMLFQQNTISLTVSIGVISIICDNSTSYAQLVSNADKLLYQAKQSGRNKIVLGGVN